MNALSVLVAAAVSVALADDAAPAGHHLRSTGAQASSYLESNWNKHDENYHPNYLLDGNPKTAWVEGVEGDGEQQWIQWPLSSIASARQLTVRVRNGYQKSDSLLVANAAPKKVALQAWFDGALVAEQTFELWVQDVQTLNAVMREIRKVKGIRSVERVRG